MFYQYSLYLALTAFGVGMIYKISIWLSRQTGPTAGKFKVSDRIYGVIRGILNAAYDGKILAVFRTFVVDVLFQGSILRQSFSRWLMHICIFWGFMLLLLMHALEPYVSAALFEDYYATVNPYMFLRDLFGAMVIFGLFIAVSRRFIMKIPRLTSNRQDVYAIVILAMIIGSGVLLEGAKIVSHTRYQEMVEDYAGSDDEEELKALEAYWVTYFNVVSPVAKGPFDEETLNRGKESHEMNCMECHSRPVSAFLGYGAAKMITPFATPLDRAGLPTVLWYIHFLACWIGLAYLPFSKMLHIFATPASLMANAIMDRKCSDAENILTRQIMEPDACTHCCVCSTNCSAAVADDVIGNNWILPSEKIAAVKALFSGAALDEQTLERLQQGVYLCTNCRRCTVVCPSGINLQDLWFTVREELLSRGYPERLVLSPFSFYRGLMKPEIQKSAYSRPIEVARSAVQIRKDADTALVPGDRKFKHQLANAVQAVDFSACYGCKTCSTVCPVVTFYETPREELDLLPHQIMQACGLGLTDEALGSRMLWDCLTCYKCQAECPQGVKVTDILYELKNIAVKKVCVKAA